MEAKFATEALPAPILKLAENLFSIEAIANLHFLSAPSNSTFGHSNSLPSRPDLSPSARERCAILAVFLV